MSKARARAMALCPASVFISCSRPPSRLDNSSSTNKGRGQLKKKHCHRESLPNLYPLIYTWTWQRTIHACVHAQIRIDKEEHLTVRFEQNQRIYYRVDLRLFSVENYKESRELLCDTNQRPISQYFPRIVTEKNAFFT